jgi:methionine-S-sulfoxide reductase
MAEAIFASGCFWCTEVDFEKVPGVVDAVSSYTGGRDADPTYETVAAGGTGHREAVQVVYDPAVVSYEHLLEVFWRTTGYTDAQGQFCDRGEQSTSAIFVSTAEERQLAEASKAALLESGQVVATPILTARKFYPAEEYHQSYASKNPIRYHLYRAACGRSHPSHDSSHTDPEAQRRTSLCASVSLCEPSV